MVRAGAGNDFCLSVQDGDPGDFIDGGPGVDHFNADSTDSWVNAEVGPEVCNGC